MRPTPLLAAAALALGLAAAPAHAAYINGGISFSDGYDATGTTNFIVSGLTYMDIRNEADAYGCAGDFGSGFGDACDPAKAISFDFFLRDNESIVFDWGGFTFFVTDFRQVNRNALECVGDLCTDSLSFLAVGYVDGLGADRTGILFNWTTQGSCTRLPGAGALCGSDVTASWSASIVATGRAPFVVPEPHGAALAGLAVMLLGLARRRPGVRS